MAKEKCANCGNTIKGKPVPSYHAKARDGQPLMYVCGKCPE